LSNISLSAKCHFNKTITYAFQLGVDRKDYHKKTAPKQVLARLEMMQLFQLLLIKKIIKS